MVARLFEEQLLWWRSLLVASVVMAMLLMGQTWWRGCLRDQYCDGEGQCYGGEVD